MANRQKAERNHRILELWDNGKGWRQKSIANMLHMKESAVSMVILRARRRQGDDGHTKEIERLKIERAPVSEGAPTSKIGDET